ncbi:MAG: response regulator [Leptospirillia bacterium]
MDVREFFKMEAAEHLEGLSCGLLALENTPSDPENIRTLFRLAHTLKGSARMVSLDDLGTVAHRIEDVLGVFRDDGVLPSGEAISSLLRAVQVIDEMVAAIGIDGPDYDIVPIVTELEATKAAARGEAPASPAEQDSTDAVTARGVSTAALDEPGSGDGLDGADDFQEGASEPDSGVPEDAAETESPVVEQGPTGGPEQAYLRVALSKIDGLANLAGELIVQRIWLNEHSGRVRILSQNAQRVMQALSQIQEWSQIGEVKEALSNTLQGEVLYGILGRIHTVALKEAFRGMAIDVKGRTSQFDQVTSNIHDGVMDLRMLPASTLTTAMQLVTRETARLLGKQVRLTIKGESIELDRALLDGLREPLHHLLRNAIDHGLEAPEERLRQGKPECGAVNVRFYRQGSRLTVTVCDDGAGFDLERIRKQVLDQGLCDASDPSLTNPEGVLHWLITPGFSTVDQVTQVSGRGVGLDVVHAAIRQLKGWLTLRNLPRGGSEIRMQLPVDLSTMEAFLFAWNGRSFAVPRESVVQVRPMDNLVRDVCAGHPVVNVDGVALPLLLMDQVVETPSSGMSDSALILRFGKRRIVIGIDRVVGVRTIIVKPLAPHVGELPRVAGMTLLASGKPAVILDLEALFALAAHKPATVSGGDNPIPPSTSGGASPTSPAPAKGMKTVLVVDDSLSARMMEKGMLERAGYRVVIAVDGEDGLTKLAQGGIDLVISDVEMPRMTGYNLLRHIREQAGTRDLPVVLMSSLNSPGSLSRGEQAGADAYLVKGETTQKMLSDTVARLIQGES